MKDDDVLERNQQPAPQQVPYPLAFAMEILQMNQRYGLEQIKPTAPAVIQRLSQFSDILDKEFCEIADIEAYLDKELSKEQTQDFGATVNETRVQLADLLADIVVYCFSEAARWDIPIWVMLQLVMASNTSKLGADGKPIINPENGKFEKGPNYWPPEPAIRALFTGKNVRVQVNEQGVASCTIEEPPTQQPQQPEAANDQQSAGEGETK